MIDDVIAGLLIIQSLGGGSNNFVSAEHDEIWAGTVSLATPEQIADLEVLGWNADKENDSFYKFV